MISSQPKPFFLDPSVQIALLFSVLWHGLWFVLLNVNMESERFRMGVNPTVVFLGPVLDNTAFKMIMEVREDSSQTFYRPSVSLAEIKDIKPQPMTRRSPGEIVSLPFETSGYTESIEGLLRQPKWVPDTPLADPLNLPVRSPAGGSGILSHRSVLNRPDPPEFPKWVDPIFRTAPVRFQIAIRPDGIVQSVELITSSGSQEVDSIWKHYLQGWRFEPAEGRKTLDSIETGEVSFQFEGKEGM